jgi:hypothetical protein
MDAFRQAGFDFLYAAPQPVPRAPWHKEMAEAARALLRPDGTVFLHCTSTEVHRFLEELRGFRLLRGKKRFGHRAVLLKKLPL